MIPNYCYWALFLLFYVEFVKSQFSFFQSPPNNRNRISARKSRFSFYREFLEPLAEVFNDIFTVGSEQDPIVDTTNGYVRGVIRRSRDSQKYFAFLGLPYSVPPIGNLRFEPPQKLTGRWEGVRDAVKYSPPCFHLDVFFSGRLMGSEDCLYLNIYTRSLKSSLPTLVYIHGGGFNSGSGDFYQGKYFMDEDVVLVIFNYRLSALGFLNTGDGIIRGNMALKDQNMLLRWVKDNIERFGGDPERVTLFGESVGAAMTQYHILSHQSQGLFHKAIALSGSVLCPWSFNGNPAASAKRLAKAAGCPTENPQSMVDCLKSVPVQKFANEYKELMKTVANPAEYFAPSAETVEMEDTFLTQHPLDLLKGNFSRIPLVTGLNSQEGLLYTARIMVNDYAKYNMEEKFSSWIPRWLYYDPNNTTMTSRLKSFYFNNDTIDLSRPEHFLNLTNIMSDGAFIHPTHEFLKHYGSSAPVYLYYNSYQGRLSVYDVLTKVPLPKFSTNDNSIPDIAEVQVGTELFADLIRYQLTNEKPSNMGASHGDTIFLLFNMRRVPGIGRLSMDYSMSKTLVKAVVDFASFSTLDDNFTYNGIPWPKVDPQDKDDPHYMHIDLPGRVIPAPFAERMKFWDNNEL